jgi:hypothetical protein
MVLCKPPELTSTSSRKKWKPNSLRVLQKTKQELNSLLLGNYINYIGTNVPSTKTTYPTDYEETNVSFCSGIKLTKTNLLVDSTKDSSKTNVLLRNRVTTDKADVTLSITNVFLWTFQKLDMVTNSIQTVTYSNINLASKLCSQMCCFAANIKTYNNMMLPLDTDSFEVKIDNCCSRTLSGHKEDFIKGTLKVARNLSVEGYSTTGQHEAVTHEGTIKWTVLNDNGD